MVSTLAASSLLWLFVGCGGPDPSPDSGSPSVTDSGDTSADSGVDTEEPDDTDTYVDTGPPPTGLPCAASGFADAPIRWKLPYRADLMNNGFHRVLDLTGDGRPDFVQGEVEWSSTGDGLGIDHWRVFANNGMWFTTPGQEWGTPDTESSSFSVVSLLHDWDGDGRIDQLRTKHDGGPPAPAVSVTEWHLHRSTGTRFSTTPSSWPIPIPVEVPSQEGVILRDLDGDGRLDFVRTEPREGSDDPDTIGVSEWLVHLNTGSGFVEQPVSWSLPLPTEALATPDLHLAELDGDGLIDLIQTDPTSGVFDETIGVSEWRLYKNTGSGFAAGVSWSLPIAINTIDAYRVHLGDIDADGVPELVQTFALPGEPEGTIGVSEWRVFRGTTAGFETVSESWPVPYPVEQWSNGNHSMVDMNGDGFLDLVQHFREGGVNDPALGIDDWFVYLSRCGPVP